MSPRLILELKELGGGILIAGGGVALLTLALKASYVALAFLDDLISRPMEAADDRES